MKLHLTENLTRKRWYDGQGVTSTSERHMRENKRNKGLEVPWYELLPWGFAADESAGRCTYRRAVKTMLVQPFRRWRNAEGEAGISFEVNGTNQSVLLDSKAFKNFVNYIMVRYQGRALREDEMEIVKETVRGECMGEELGSGEELAAPDGGW